MPLDPTFQYVLAQLANTPRPAAISRSALLLKRGLA